MLDNQQDLSDEELMQETDKILALMNSQFEHPTPGTIDTQVELDSQPGTSGIQLQHVPQSSTSNTELNYDEQCDNESLISGSPVESNTVYSIKCNVVQENVELNVDNPCASKKFTRKQVVKEKVNQKAWADGRTKEKVKKSF